MSLSVQNKFETLNLKFTVDIVPEKKINMVITCSPSRDRSQTKP